MKTAKGVKSRNRDIFLFNDLMLVTKMKGKAYKIYEQINLYLAALQDLVEDGENTSLTYSMTVFVCSPHEWCLTKPRSLF